jgi:hypothetical protein
VAAFDPRENKLALYKFSSEQKEADWCILSPVT